MIVKVKQPKIINGIENWKCCRCLEWTTDYFPDRKARNGLRSLCKECSRIALRKLDRKTDETRKYYRIYNITHKRDPVKVFCRSKLNYAIRHGEIKRPKICKRCRKHKRITAHHKDYSRPLDVMWLCYLCHAEVERGELV